MDHFESGIHEQPKPRNAACGSAYFRTVFDKYVWGGCLLFAWWIGAGLLHKKRVNLTTHPSSLTM